MPGLSGLDLCRRIKSSPRGPATYVMMLTGKQSKQEFIEALESGADDVMSKPFHLRELQLRITRGVEATVARPSAVMRALTKGGLCQRNCAHKGAPAACVDAARSRPLSHAEARTALALR
jgi:two-component system phosphate regulon response regulator PhoB